MYRVKSIMGDTAFQVIKEPYSVIRTFYTKQAAKEFADRLTTEEYLTYSTNYIDAPDYCSGCKYTSQYPNFPCVSCTRRCADYYDSE